MWQTKVEGENIQKISSRKKQSEVLRADWMEQQQQWLFSCAAEKEFYFCFWKKMKPILIILQWLLPSLFGNKNIPTGKWFCWMNVDLFVYIWMKRCLITTCQLIWDLGWVPLNFYFVPRNLDWLFGKCNNNYIWLFEMWPWRKEKSPVCHLLVQTVTVKRMVLHKFQWCGFWTFDYRYAGVTQVEQAVKKWHVCLDTVYLMYLFSL